VVILITWPDFERDGEDTGRRLVEAGHALRFAPKRAQRSPREMIALLEGVAAAIVSTDPFDAEVLDSAADLRVIARVGVGTDSIAAGSRCARRRARTPPAPRTTRSR
jgi:phosphoglycerate dehydrogenase-like enzyme